MTDLTGKIVAVLQDGAPMLALVTTHGNTKLQLVDARGRQHKSHTRYLLTAFSRTASIANVQEVIEPLYRQIAERRREVDTAFLWECLAETPDDYEIDQLAEIFFDESEPDQQVALFEELRADNMRFKIKGQTIQVRDRQVVEEQLLARQRQEEKEAWERQAMAWLQTLMGADEAMGVPDEMEPLVHLIEDFLLRRQDNEAVKWLEELDNDTPPRELAFELLVLLDRIPDDADPLLVIAGIDPSFSAEVKAAAKALQPFQPGPDREDFTHLEPFSVDDEDTREIDDALTVEELEDGNFRVGIHIADVAHFVTKDDALDREAVRRCATVYLPTGAVTMFPDRVACDLASLNQGELRPCMTCLATFSPAGELLETRFTRGTVRVAHRLTYDEADAHLSDPDSSVGWQLTSLVPITDALREQRHQAGAITIVKPEVKVFVDSIDDDIEIKTIDPQSPSRQIIAELMILSNSQAGEFAVRHDLPVIFRGQPAPSEKIVPPTTYDPVLTNQLFRQLRRSRTSTHPQRHSGLGLDAYTQSTSPLRRFTDLITQRQIASHLAGEEAPYDDTELLSIIGIAGDVEQDNRGIERQATRFYVMSYLDMHCRDTPLGATVLNTIPGGALVELDDYLVRGRLNTNSPPSAGTHLNVVLLNVDARRGRMSLRASRG